MRVAVVAHVEWIEFARVPRMPEPGKIVHAASGGTTAAAGDASVSAE